MTSILVVDNDPDAREAVRCALKREEYAVIEAESATLALTLAKKHRPAVVILDIVLPDMSGFELCSRLRATPLVDRTPILFLSAYQSAHHVARALDCGGDDYLRKPFIARELYARVRALLRRATRQKFYATITLRMDPDRHRVFVNNTPVALTPTEFLLLEYLCRHPGEHHTASSLLQALWQYPPGAGDTALVRNHIRNLRRKIELNPDRPAIIQSFHGRGYRVTAQVMN